MELGCSAADKSGVKGQRRALCRGLGGDKVRIHLTCVSQARASGCKGARRDQEVDSW